MNSLKLLAIVILLLLSAGCTSKQIVCQPEPAPEWVMQPMPVELGLIEQLLEALEK